MKKKKKLIRKSNKKCTETSNPHSTLADDSGCCQRPPLHSFRSSGVHLQAYLWLEARWEPADQICGLHLGETDHGDDGARWPRSSRWYRDGRRSVQLPAAVTHHLRWTSAGSRGSARRFHHRLNALHKPTGYRTCPGPVATVADTAVQSHNAAHISKTHHIFLSVKLSHHHTLSDYCI